MKNIEITHESYGAAMFSRVHSTGTHLFYSALRHHDYIILRISRASLIRDKTTHHSRISTVGNDSIVEIAMSEAQFGQLISTFNRGEGIPVTIMSVGNQDMQDAPPDTTRQSFESELKEDLSEFSSMLDALSTKVKELCEKKGPLTQTEKKDLINTAEATVTEIKSNLPFFQAQFEKAMEKSVSQAITEVEAHVQGLINRTGLAALANMAPAIEYKE